MVRGIVAKTVKSFSWIPAFAGMTNRGAIPSHIQSIFYIGSIEKFASLLVIPAKAGIQIKIIFNPAKL